MVQTFSVTHVQEKHKRNVKTDAQLSQLLARERLSSAIVHIKDTIQRYATKEHRAVLTLALRATNKTEKAIEDLVVDIEDTKVGSDRGSL